MGQLFVFLDGPVPGYELKAVYNLGMIEDEYAKLVPALQMQFSTA